MSAPIPNIRGISELQRQGRKALGPIFEEEGQSAPVFLSDRNKLFGVVLSLEDYEALLQNQEEAESRLWLSALSASLNFWNHPSNDAYEKLL